MMAFEAAQAAIISACRPHAVECVALSHAVGRILSQDTIATEDLVPFARSAMDGYAVRSSDITQTPITLPIAGYVYAAPGAQQLVPGTVSMIATGAAIPAGADCVIPFEHVCVNAQSVTISRRVTPGACIFPPGDDARRGDVIVARGTHITPASIGLLAAAGIPAVAVFAQPTVAIICGGDELVGIDELPGYGQVRDSNGIMLAGAITAAGARALAPVRLRDDRSAVQHALDRALQSADLVVTTGGASVGERDFIKSACADLGVDFLFRSVALRPAKPTAFGRRGNASIAVLPGNPAAAFVAFQQFVQPAIRALGGHADALLPRVRATLRGSINAKPGRHFAAFAAVSIEAGALRATPLDNQCSSLTRTAADGAGFIIVPPGSSTYSDGAAVDVDVFDWSRVTTRAAQNTPQQAAELLLV